MFDISKLNENQRQAVTSDFGPIVVIAGAGTGKTRVLTCRISYLIENKGLTPEKILAITFTNKAANEMKERITQETGNKVLSWIGTYHSICLKILRVEIEILGRKSDFAVIDEEDKKVILNEVYKSLSLEKKDYPFGKIIGTISKIKTSNIDVINTPWNQLKDYFGEWGDSYNFSTIVKIYQEFQKKLLDQNALDFDDLLLLTLNIFDTYPDICSYWKNKFEYILVDEFQDTNLTQFKLLLHLINHDKNIFVVGDPDQTIYTWRGAYSEIFSDFYKIFKSAKTILLDNNYRSTKKILHIANNIIAHNTNRVEKNLKTQNAEGENITIYIGKENGDEAKYVAKEIKKIISEKKYDYKDIAIIYRMNNLSRDLEEKMVNYNIPYNIFGGLGFYQRKHIKDLISYLQLVDNPSKEIFLKRIINIPNRKITELTVEKISNFAKEKKISFFEALLLSYDSDYELPWKHQPVVEFLNLLRSLHEIKEYPIHQILETIIEKTNYLVYIKEFDDDQEKTTERIADIEEFVNSIKQFEASAETEVTIADYLQEISVMTSNTKKNLVNAVSMMTIHIAKGLEFPVVFVCGLNEGSFPSMMSDNLHEERRIAYVAFTRAKEKLYLSASGGYNYMNKQAARSSRFINEIGKDFITYGTTHIENISNKDTWFDSNKDVDFLDNYEEKKEEIFVGDSIIHTIFGEGLVIEKEKEYLTVVFKNPGYGRKIVSANHKNVIRKN
ncbi:MAG: UvrD-helicase domain-containing protein [Mycoplasmataceae bacterium]|nr:UvrD-helicase domain-containing protein [Mycoplasmataceae bacterium]